MLKEPISITALSSISALGNSAEEVWSTYLDNNHSFSKIDIAAQKVWVSKLPKDIKASLQDLRKTESKYAALDETVLYAVYSARKAVEQASWNSSDNFGINIGSSRGATSLFEKYHKEYLESGKSSTLSSPTTTLGNISSWVAHDLKTKGPDISHSITCSTALHAILNGIAWIQSGMADKFLVGGAEAPLTPFTIAQMQALKIYSKEEGKYPCKALDLKKKKNTMVLGEGAGMACLEKGKKTNALALIAGIGYATETLKHSISISTEAQCFQDSMKMALGDMNPEEVDIVVMHSPGTIKGDISEVNAIEKVFCNKIPFLTTNKWKVGHTFGASGLLSVEMALLMLQNQTYIQTPFLKQDVGAKPIQKVMVNAVGFGGNAVSILLSK
ncbi:beta-ketoacyl synthase N-terminal-like domain-containing protein [Flagellimonas pacifica]|uniref:3-oxoacyl-(Acyl-carrier-protein) synthase n=1 Tax=Flagellimonas pacifica TaxID=1247520 RepID=A0A285MC03_9FLAO|nr:beta-ketoacyl synthase N-terminal-like domain-containing protein [Allomuricauda parva]SNY94695.1 3-oxoacyl-(acyl-carrier-protein) synthase [Allomuricauda parva]